ALLDTSQEGGGHNRLLLRMYEQVRAVVIADVIGELMGQQRGQLVGAAHVAQHHLRNVDIAVWAGSGAEGGIVKKISLPRQIGDPGRLLEALQLLVDVAFSFRVAHQAKPEALITVTILFLPYREHAGGIGFIDLREDRLIRRKLAGDEVSHRLGGAGYAA